MEGAHSYNVNVLSWVVSQMTYMQITVTSTSQYQIFVEKFVQEPKKVRIKMADLAGP